MAVQIPFFGSETGQTFINSFTVNRQHLQIISAGVGCTAEDKSAFVLIGEIRLDGIKAHKGREGDAVSLETFKRFTGIMFSR
ncbi:hypothetical protein EVA_15058 [gut metagenome]|uniref:Uncharacterized protein n=1 Tax=gut metagenome TaxID=749906 RepID=J9CA80_9ZZZZ